MRARCARMTLGALMLSLVAGLASSAVGCADYGSPVPREESSDEEPAADGGDQDGTLQDQDRRDGESLDDGPRDAGGDDGGPGDADDTGPRECPTFISALATCPFQLFLSPGPAACIETECLTSPCRRNSDCPITATRHNGALCVAGTCAFCSQDSHCPAGQLCRAGRCVEPVTGCPPPAPCSADRCHWVSPSELPCPICVCDTIFGITCRNDPDCQIISSHPYARCVWGRCAECKDDGDCPAGLRCLPPGLCFIAQPHPSALYGTWLIGWGGGMDHFSYFRFEPDGTLRRGRYTPSGSWADDIPTLPCNPVGVLPSPLLGTWEIEPTQAIGLAIRMNLNLSCDPGAGWSARYWITLSADGQTAQLNDIDLQQIFEAQRVSSQSCSDEFASCLTPSIMFLSYPRSLQLPTPN